MSELHSFTNLTAMLADRTALGPVAVCLVEDGFLVTETLERLAVLGFGSIVLANSSGLPVESPLDRVFCLELENAATVTLPGLVNRLMPALAGQWVHACYNAEFLFYPDCETRQIAEATAFAADELRVSISGQTIDLYWKGNHPSGLTAGETWFDPVGYFGLELDEGSLSSDRFVDIRGGMRWRLSEHIPADRQGLGRTCMFRAGPGVEMQADQKFRPISYNAYSCPHHGNLTMAVASFRAAKALSRNPGTAHIGRQLAWEQSARFDFASEQLLKLGFMEPGQWF